MNFLLKVMILISTLTLFLITLGNMLSMKLLSDMEKPSVFECGFYSKVNSWSPFSMSFFLSATIFLVFDVELVLIFPYFISYTWKFNSLSMFVTAFFLAWLSVGFFLEWSQKLLDWKM